MTNVQAAHPENNVFGNVGGVIGDALQVAGGEDELHAGTNEDDILSHVLQEIFENAVAILVDNIIAFEHLRGHVGIAKDQSAQAAADHGTNRFRHGSQFLRG